MPTPINWGKILFGDCLGEKVWITAHSLFFVVLLGAMPFGARSPLPLFLALFLIRTSAICTSAHLFFWLLIPDPLGL